MRVDSGAFASAERAPTLTLWFFFCGAKICVLIVAHHTFFALRKFLEGGRLYPDTHKTSVLKKGFLLTNNGDKNCCEKGERRQKSKVKSALSRPLLRHKPEGARAHATCSAEEGYGPEPPLCSGVRKVVPHEQFAQGKTACEGLNRMP